MRSLIHPITCLGLAILTLKRVRSQSSRRNYGGNVNRDKKVSFSSVIQYFCSCSALPVSTPPLLFPANIYSVPKVFKEILRDRQPFFDEPPES